MVVIKVVEAPTCKQEPKAEERERKCQEVLNEVAKEYSLGTRCQHENIVEYYGFGVDEDGDIGLVMEHLDGGHLGDFIQNPKDA
jgi:serine/threonine protein kinase